MVPTSSKIEQILAMVQELSLTEKVGLTQRIVEMFLPPEDSEHASELQFREAVQPDLPSLVAMLADDPLGAQREDDSSPLNLQYNSAFTSILADPNNELIVVELGTQIVGMLQLTFIPYLTYIGSWRCLIEGVRIHKDFRGQGLGTQLFEWAINRAKERGCHLVQLTSDKKRPDALRFYESLGFVASHEGFKLKFDS